MCIIRYPWSPGKLRCYRNFQLAGGRRRWVGAGAPDRWRPRKTKAVGTLVDAAREGRNPTPPPLAAGRTGPGGGGGESPCGSPPKTNSFRFGPPCGCGWEGDPRHSDASCSLPFAAVETHLHCARKSQQRLYRYLYIYLCFTPRLYIFVFDIAQIHPIPHHQPPLTPTRLNPYPPTVYIDLRKTFETVPRLLLPPPPAGVNGNDV